MIATAIIILLNPTASGFADMVQTAPKKENIDLYQFILRFECGGSPSKKSLVAYWDHKGYSIGCGTPSYKGEIISKEEAIKRFYEYTKIRVNLVKKHFPKLTGDQLTAVVSLTSNNGTCYNIYRQGKLTRQGWLKCDKVKENGKLKALPGLTKRRAEEVNLYFGEKSK